jgi:hypothetical protein
LLHLTLDVLGATGTQDINQTRFVDISMDDLAPSFIAESSAVSSPVA